MIRKIIQIDEEKCNGCGACANACHEGAIAMVDGKAKLLRDDYCDGLGNCLPACPAGAITFIEREAAAYDEAAVEASRAAGRRAAAPVSKEPLACGCPGTQSRTIERAEAAAEKHEDCGCPSITSRLSQWPVQIQLAPANAPYFNGARLLIAADCTAYARADFHERFIRNHITLIGCPKLDRTDYAEKLTEILRHNEIKSITVVRMEVPCCGGMEHAVKTALQNSGKMIPWQVVTLGTNGEILD
jgi:ferredoxin